MDVYDITSENNPKKIRRIHLAPPRPYTSFVFSPDSSGFVTFSEFSLYVFLCVRLSLHCIVSHDNNDRHATYWDLTTSPTASPPVLTKLKSPQCSSFNSAKPNLFAAISRRCKDRLNIYVVPSLTYVLYCLLYNQAHTQHKKNRLLLTVPIPTRDAKGCAWSPDGRLLLIYDSVLSYRVLIVSSEGEIVSRFEPSVRVIIRALNTNAFNTNPLDTNRYIWVSQVHLGSIPPQYR